MSKVMHCEGLGTLDVNNVASHRPILVGQARKPIFNSLTPYFLYNDLSIEKTWVTLC